MGSPIVETHGRASLPVNTDSNQTRTNFRLKKLFIMNKKFKNKYRIPSNRMPGWDYAGDGMYFITLVIQYRHCIFGKIENQQMVLNDWGEIACREWMKSFEIRDELSLDAFVLMPNHLHAIVVIDKSVNGDTMGYDGVMMNGDMRHVRHVETHGRASLQSTEHSQPPHLHRKPKSLSSFIAGYKSAVTIQINNFIDQSPDRILFPDLGKFNRKNHLWQPNYNDHIIRNEIEYHRITNYIKNNPAKWQDDKFFEP